MNFIKKLILFRLNQAEIKTKGKIIAWIILSIILTSCSKGCDGTNEFSGKLIKVASEENSLFNPPVLKAKSPTVIEVSWNKIEEAKEFEIIRSADDNILDAHSISTTEATLFTDINLVPKTKYYYWINLCFEVGQCNSAKKDNYGVIETPGLDSLSLNAPTLTVINETEIKISWGSVEGAKLFKVYRLQKNNINSVNTFQVFALTDTSSNKGDIIGTINSTSYSDKNLTLGATYYYWYKACSLESECSDFSKSAFVTIPSEIPDAPSAPALTVINNIDIQSTWVSVNNAISTRFFVLKVTTTQVLLLWRQHHQFYSTITT